MALSCDGYISVADAFFHGFFCATHMFVVHTTHPNYRLRGNIRMNDHTHHYNLLVKRYVARYSREYWAEAIVQPSFQAIIPSHHSE